jgi:hypothetical protein
MELERAKVRVFSSRKITLYFPCYNELDLRFFRLRPAFEIALSHVRGMTVLLTGGHSLLSDDKRFLTLLKHMWGILNELHAR